MVVILCLIAWPATSVLALYAILVYCLLKLTAVAVADVAGTAGTVVTAADLNLGFSVLSFLAGLSSLLPVPRRAVSSLGLGLVRH